MPNDKPMTYYVDMDPPNRSTIDHYAQQRDHWDSVKLGSAAVGATMAVPSKAYPNPVTPVDFKFLIIWLKLLFVFFFQVLGLSAAAVGAGATFASHQSGRQYDREKQASLDHERYREHKIQEMKKQHPNLKVVRNQTIKDPKTGRYVMVPYDGPYRDWKTFCSISNFTIFGDCSGK